MEYITKKPKLLRCIQREARVVQAQIGRLSPNNQEQLAYLKAKAENLYAFSNTIEIAPLFDVLDNWWTYEFSIGSLGTALYIRHIGSAEIEGKEGNEWLTVYDYDATYQLIQNDCRLLTAKEYATSRNAVASSVRVWIRRGKLRSAVKVGNSWRIPELTPPIKRGYFEASYEWNIYHDNVPVEYEALKEPGNLIIRKDSSKQGFIVMVFDKQNVCRREFYLAAPATEKFEAMLIANPAVLYTGDTQFIRQ